MFKKYFCFFVLFLASCSSKVVENKEIKFGLVADCQYCNKPKANGRFYDSSLERLKVYVNAANKEELLFTIHLGDLIDEREESFAPVLNILANLKTPVKHVLGNHDFSVSDNLKAEVPKILSMPAKYYSFVEENWRFIILDGNDISFYAHPKESEAFKEAEKYYKDNKLTSAKYNGAMSHKQLQWLENELQLAEKSQQKVLLFSHFPIYPKNSHNLWNDAELISLIEKFSCVKAYINGHNHAGNYGEKNGIHYYTQKGMVQFEKASYSFVTLKKGSIIIHGFGEQKDLILNYEN